MGTVFVKWLEGVWSSRLCVSVAAGLRSVDLDRH